MSIQCIVRLAVADWLFAFSLLNNDFDGNFEYVILIILVCVCQIRNLIAALLRQLEGSLDFEELKYTA